MLYAAQAKLNYRHSRDLQLLLLQLLLILCSGEEGRQLCHLN